MNLLGCLEVAGELATINRYSKSKLNNPENVLEHTGFVSMIAYFVGHAINNSESEKKVDIGVLLSRCIVHDVEEFVTGDVQRPTKHSSPEMLSLFDELSSNAILEVSAKTDNKEIIRDWSNSKKGYEGSIVAFCDAFSVVYKAYDEVVLRGNKTIQFGSTVGLLKIVGKRINELAMQGINDIITISLSDTCKALIEEIQECLK